MNTIKVMQTPLFFLKPSKVLALLMLFFSPLLVKIYIYISIGAFFGRIGLSPAVMGWAASCDDGP